MGLIWSPLAIQVCEDMAVASNHKKRLAGASEHPAILHVGYPRASSTTHQHQLFSKHKDIAYLGKPYPTPAIQQLLRSIAKLDSAFFDPGTARQAMEKIVSETVIPNGRVLTISDEQITASRRIDTPVFCRRIVDLFGDPKVVIVIRRQDDWLVSWLSYVIRKPHRLPFADSLHMVEKEALNSTGVLYELDYASICGAFAKGLGRDNVLVVPFELFKCNKRAYAEALSGFMNIDVEQTHSLLRESKITSKPRSPSNVAYYDFKQRYLPNWGEGAVARYADLTLAKLFSTTGINVGRVNEIEARARALCAERYAESNRALNEAFGLDLRSYGYPGL